MRQQGVHPLYWSGEEYQPPANWGIRPIKDYATVVKGRMPSELFKEPQEGSLPYLLIDGLGEGESLYTNETNLPTTEESDTVVVADGSRSGLAIRGVRGVLGSTLLAYRAKAGVDSDYLYYVLESLYPFNNTATIGGAIPHLDKRLLAKLTLATPEPDEQRRIAAALNLADDAIDKARAELAATRELKRSLMHSLFVTGMPDRHREFQETKIGPVPLGWQVRTIRSVLAEKPDSGTSPLSRPDPPGTPILNVSCVKAGVCDPADVTYVDVSDDEIERYRARAGDFFVLRGNGNRDYVATGGLLRAVPPADAIYSDKLIRLRFSNEEVAERFIPYLWQSHAFLTRLQSKAESGSGLWMMSKRDIVREQFACPSLAEQKEMVALLDNAENQLIAQTGKVAALQEVKRALLQNLLTGKIRIPEGVLYA